MTQPLRMTPEKTDSRDSRMQVRVASRHLRRAVCSETSPQFCHVISRHSSASECIMLGRPNTFLYSSFFFKVVEILSSYNSLQPAPRTLGLGVEWGAKQWYSNSR